MKALIFDSGPLINFSLNGFLYILEGLRKDFNGKFIITKEVFYEVVKRPEKVPRFELGALRVKDLLHKEVLEFPSALGISDEEITKKTKDLMLKANSFLKIDSKPIDIVSEAEISCLALSILLKEKQIESIVAIDERTTRLLTESPKDLAKIISQKIHKRVVPEKEPIQEIKDIIYLRSSELIYVAHKKDLIKIKDPKILEASLFATKYHGSSISFEEIRALKKL